MEKNKKKIRIIFWSVLIVLSAIVGALIAHFDPPSHLRRTAITLWLFAAVAAAIAIDMIWLKEMKKQLGVLAQLLPHDPDGYIEGINRLLGDKKGRAWQQIRIINISAALCEKRDFNQARRVLEGLSPQKIPRVNRVIYWANLALACFCSGDHAAGSQIMSAQGKTFASMADSDVLGAQFAMLDILYLFYGGKKDEAAQKLALAKSHWPQVRHKRDLDYLTSIIDGQ